MISRLRRLLQDHPDRWHRGELRATHRRTLLLLDFDGPAPPFPLLAEGLARLGCEPLAVCYAPSHSRGHWHVMVELQRALPSDAAVIFCQLWLGSDRERERCNYIRVMLWGRSDPLAQVLFSRKKL